MQKLCVKINLIMSNNSPSPSLHLFPSSFPSVSVCLFVIYDAAKSNQYDRSCIIAEASHGKRILLETPDSLISIPHQFAFMMILGETIGPLVTCSSGMHRGTRMLVARKIVNNIYYCRDVFITATFLSHPFHLTFITESFCV